MATAPATQPQTLSLVADAIAITCPPIPNGGGHGLLLKPTFMVCGTWDSSAANPKVNCVFITTGNQSINPTSLNVNSPPPNSWNATFTINAGTNGKLHATITVNGVVTAGGDVNNLQVVANGGGTCTC